MRDSINGPRPGPPLVARLHATLGTERNFILFHDVSSSRHEKTLARLAILNQAVLAYNAHDLATDPLSPN